LWYQQTDSEGREGNDSAWGAVIGLPNNEGFKSELGYTELGENFNPALGFANRRGIKQSEAMAGYVTHFGAGSWLRSMENRVNYERITTTQGDVESEELDINLIELENQSGEEFSFEINDLREVLTESFEISDGVVIPVGDYSFTRYGIEVSTGRHRKVFATVVLEEGEFYGGDRSTFEVELDWQPNKYFIGSFEFQYNDIELPQGSFDTQLFRLNTEVAFNPEWAWISTVQFDNQSDSLGVNSRLQWIPRAGQEFYLIYNGGWLDDELDGFQKVGQSATIKLNYTYRF